MKLMFLNKLESAESASGSSQFVMPKVTFCEFKKICEQKGLSLDFADLDDSEMRLFSAFFKFCKI